MMSLCRCPLAYSNSLIQFYPSYLAHISDSLCGAKTAGFSIEVQTLLPREKKLPID